MPTRIYEGTPRQRQEQSLKVSRGKLHEKQLVDEELQWLGLPEKLPAPDDPVLEAEHRILTTKLDQLLADMPIELRTALVRHAVDGQSLDEVGHSLGLSPDDVSKMIKSYQGKANRSTRNRWDLRKFYE